MVADKLDLLLVLHTTGALEENGWSTKLPWENVASDVKSSLLMAKIVNPLALCFFSCGANKQLDY